MKHNIRQRQLDPNTGLIVTKIVKVEGELGSGVLDKNGREIFEGDLVKFGANRTHIVIFSAGRFIIGNSDFGINCFDPLEIVGHAED